MIQQLENKKAELICFNSAFSFQKKLIKNKINTRYTNKEIVQLHRLWW